MACTDDRIIKKMALVSPDLPKLVQSLSVHHPKENEILLLGGLETVDTCPTYLHSQTQGQQRGTDVCLVPRLGGRRHTRPDSIAMEINRFLVGLRWGRDRRCPAQGQPCGERGAEDDTNRSISSIEEDFLTASEQLGDDSEDDAFRNEPEMSDMAEVAQKHNGGSRLPCQRGPPARLESDGVQTNTCTPVSRRATMPPKTGPHAQEESAGLYATNLAESVLQDAFIRLSQDEGSFTPEAAVSVSLPCPPARAGPASCPSPAKQPSQQRTYSFELPKIVIVQSPDSSEGPAEWPETQTPQQVPDKDVCAKAVVGETQLPNLHRAGGHPSKPVEVALACAASVIGTITAPQLTEQIAMESASEGDTEEDLQDSEEGTDYSFSSTMCGMARVAGVVAAVDLTEESGEGADSDAESPEVYKPSRGLMTAAEASAAFTLHCSVAEGTSIEVFRANIAEVLHREAFQVLAQPQGYKSVAHMLELTHNKIVDGITRNSYPDEIEVDEFISEVAEYLFRHALDKAKKTKDLEAPKKDAQNYQSFLQESVNNLLFEILCTMQKKISDISRCHRGPFDTQEAKEPLGKLQRLVDYSLPSNSEYQSGKHYCTDKLPTVPGHRAEHYILEDKESDAPGSPDKEHQQQPHKVKPLFTLFAKDSFDNQQVQQLKGPIREPHGEISVIATEKRGWLGTGSDSRQSYLNSYNSSSLPLRKNPEFRTPVTGFADDLAATVVSMATELAAICLDNSAGKQPWFCALKGTSGEGPEAYLLPACRTALRRKEGQNGSSAASKKHRAPRLSEIKRKTEEQPELMERLVNRVVDEAVVPGDETQDPFALFASEVTARIMNCPELSVVDTSKPGQPRSSRLQCERWSRGKASSYESIPEEDCDPTGTPNTLGPGSHLGQNLSRGSSISKQSSCESITDEFSRFMVNQMETEGRGFDLLLDYYAGKNASSILAAAVQQAATKRNGHLNVRASSCLSKQSSTESITEEFYRFMLKDMDKENREYGIAKTKEWSNSLLPPSPRTPFCIRQSSVPDRRSSDSRLSVNSPIKANSFDGFPRNAHGDTLNIYPSNSVSATGLCKSDSCLYQLGKTDQITDMLIHETWSSSIESLMRKNKIIMDPEDSIELEEEADSQPHVQQYANRLAADIVETGKSALGAQPDATGNSFGWQSRSHVPVGERRRGFKQSRPSCSRSKASPEQGTPGAGGSNNSAPRPRGPRDVPLIQIEGDQKEEVSVQDTETTGECPQDVPVAKRKEKAAAAGSSNVERGWPADKRSKKRSTSASSEESTGSWAHVTPDEDPHEETSSFIQLSEGNGTSSASSLGLAEQEAFAEVHSPSAVASKEAERPHLIYSKENVPDSSSTQTAGISSRELLLLNCDLDPESVDSELRVALQWIAASELGLPTLYFRMSRDTRAAKFQRVVHLVSQKVWRVADLFSAVVQFCQLHEEEEQRGGRTLSSLFDWLLENF